MKKLIRVSFSVLLSFYMISCGSGDSSQEKEKDLEDVVVDQVDPEFKEEFKAAIKKLPSPLEISQFINSTGAAYNREILNPYEDVDKYMTTNQKKALNLGIYVADLGYSCAYYVQEDIIQYVNAVKVVSDQLGVSGAFGQEKIAKFEQSLPNKDSLIKVVTENIYLTDDILIENDKLDMTALILAGSFIEGLHISTSIVKNYPNDLPDEFRFQILNPIITEIDEQEETLALLLDIMSNFEDNEAIDQMESRLAELNDVYSGIKENKAQVPESEDVNADAGMMVEPVLNKEQLEMITNKVVEIRNVIIS
ncbi:hypothetical protein HZR84_01995 [Hyphobacterium sp. CCMP332]|nr:hypothetical protein HZR84_01995 [Hyphobacterium sp. CCMP332]